MFASTKVQLFSQKHQFLAINRICVILHHFLTIHNWLIHSNLQKSYKKEQKKTKKMIRPIKKMHNFAAF